MKTELTIEQSQRLIELGVDAKLTSKSHHKYTQTGKGVGCIVTVHSNPIFTLTDLLSILPKNIDGNVIEIISAQVDVDKEDIKDGWLTYYSDREGIVTYGRDSIFQADELIDSLYLLLCWVIENEYINLKEK